MAQTNLHTIIPEIWNTDDHKDQDISCKSTVSLLTEWATMRTYVISAGLSQLVLETSIRKPLKEAGI